MRATVALSEHVQPQELWNKFDGGNVTGYFSLNLLFGQYYMETNYVLCATYGK